MAAQHKGTAGAGGGRRGTGGGSTTTRGPDGGRVPHRLSVKKKSEFTDVTTEQLSDKGAHGDYLWLALTWSLNALPAVKAGTVDEGM